MRKRWPSDVDHYLIERMAKESVSPAPLTDDAAFLRRVYLDLAGCIPSIIDARDFLDDTRPNKRHIWVDLILDGKKPSRKPDAFNQHFANVYRAWILSRVNSEQGAALAPALENWLRERFKANAPYDRLVRELMTPAPSDNYNVYYQINENKPESLAASTSRLFLGIKLECHQCHDDRSGGSWSQEQFWSFAAFFAGYNPQSSSPTNKKEIAIPGKKKTVRARFLDDTEPSWKRSDNPRRPRRLARQRQQSLFRPRCGQQALVVLLRHRTNRPHRRARPPQSAEPSRAARRFGPAFYRT